MRLALVLFAVSLTAAKAQLEVEECKAKLIYIHFYFQTFRSSSFMPIDVRTVMLESACVAHKAACYSYSQGP